MTSRRDFMALGVAGGMGAVALGRGTALAQSSDTSAPSQAEASGQGAYIAMWYQLGSEDQAKFTAWLHEEYLPTLTTRPGFIWVAHYRAPGEAGPGAASVRGLQQLVLIRANRSEDVLEQPFLDHERASMGRTRMFLDLCQDLRTDIFIPMPGFSPMGAADIAQIPPVSLALHAFRATEQAEFKILKLAIAEAAAVAKSPSLQALSYLGGVDGLADAAILLASANADHRRLSPMPGLASLVSYIPGSPFHGQRAWYGS